MINTNQRDVTNNQSTVDYIRKQIFLYGNEFQDTIVANTTITEQTVKTGQLVIRDSTAGQVKLATDADLTDVIGITYLDGESILAAASTAGNTDGGTVSAHYAINGTIDSGLLELPGAATLDTMVGNKALRDILADLGFVLRTVTENLKADN